MIKKGIAASVGYAIGEVVIKDSFELHISERNVENVKAEIARFNNAIEVCRRQINHLKDKALLNFGADKAELYENQLLLLDDPKFAGAIVQEVKDREINAEKAVKNILDMYLEIFIAMDDEYMRGLAADIKDVSIRILANLYGHQPKILRELKPNSILVASDLTPSDTAELDKEKITAILTNMGGRTSHSAIMAKSLEIPAVVGLKDITTCVKQGDIIIVDGEKGEVILKPDDATIEDYRSRKEAFEEVKRELRTLKSIKGITSYGKSIEVAANIGSLEEVDKALENGADGIGLFRTESLFMNRGSIPSEDEQFESYKYVLEKMNGKPVTVRTLDIGADKNVGYLNRPKEDNPFLGYRGIRLCLDQKWIFKTQLRALLRASIYGNLKIMFPMISGVEEVLGAKDVINECAKELTSEGYAFKNVEIGIMVEVPAAAIIAAELAQHVDFLSIGTNDLIQYALAADRMNDKVSYLYNPSNPAILKLIRMTVEGAHKAGKWCGMCGEMAGDEEYIPLLVEYGLDELSMGVPSILRVKRAILDL